jgi:hypothetical protein
MPTISKQSVALPSSHTSRPTCPRVTLLIPQYFQCIGSEVSGWCLRAHQINLRQREHQDLPKSPCYPMIPSTHLDARPLRPEFGLINILVHRHEALRQILLLNRSISSHTRQNLLDRRPAAMATTFPEIISLFKLGDMLVNRQEVVQQLPFTTTTHIGLHHRQWTQRGIDRRSSALNPP